jgi:hypothetical protein
MVRNIGLSCVGDFGEPIDVHLIISRTGHRKSRRALGDAKLVGDSLTWPLVSEVTSSHSFRNMKSTCWALRSIGMYATNRFERRRRLFTDALNSSLPLRNQIERAVTTSKRRWQARNGLGIRINAKTHDAFPPTKARFRERIR